MRRASGFLAAAITVVVTTAATASGPFDGAPNAPFGAIAPVPAPRPSVILPDEARVFGFIAETLHLGIASDGDLIRRLQAGSSVDHLHDYRGEPIFAVKPELLGADGESRVRAADGNYPFFVFDQTEHGWHLLGQMQGRSYAWSTETHHLIFDVSRAMPGKTPAVVRYEVNPGFLVNLTELAKDEAEARRDTSRPDWNRAF
jgi:hypothetical protein